MKFSVLASLFLVVAIIGCSKSSGAGGPATSEPIIPLKVQPHDISQCPTSIVGNWMYLSPNSQNQTIYNFTMNGNSLVLTLDQDSVYLDGTSRELGDSLNGGARTLYSGGCQNGQVLISIASFVDDKVFSTDVQLTVDGITLTETYNTGDGHPLVRTYIRQ